MKTKVLLRGSLTSLDVIFDCTTDNQLMRVMDSVGAKAQLVNLSITNHAQDLICAFSPNVTETVLLIYDLLSVIRKLICIIPQGVGIPHLRLHITT